MIPSARWPTLCLFYVFSSSIFAQNDPQLTGTWSTKSNKVFTGPGFYDPVNERLKEPELTGISYSFTDDGFYEEAYYRALGNPQVPSCPRGLMQFQHGTFTKTANGSLILTPFAVDGRQLLSDPCQYSNSIYTRYNQSENFLRYEVFKDPYHGVMRLNLYRFDGSPMNAMYLAYKPPQMLPTQTMNPTTSATAAAQARQTGSGKVKRGLEDMSLPLNKHVLRKRQKDLGVHADTWWWFGVALTALVVMEGEDSEANRSTKINGGAGGAGGVGVVFV
ncbi:MAG: Reversal of tor2 lethality [Peltula sp. TS41687]|nr:MAG: Reversal of tor2 lethality [Peltula sp. TS41687]